jgi:hypothetical protein
MKGRSWRCIIAAGNYEQIAEMRFENIDLPQINTAQRMREHDDSCRLSANATCESEATVDDQYSPGAASGPIRIVCSSEILGLGVPWLALLHFVDELLRADVIEVSTRRC